MRYKYGSCPPRRFNSCRSSVNPSHISPVPTFIHKFSPEPSCAHASLVSYYLRSLFANDTHPLSNLCPEEYKRHRGNWKSWLELVLILTLWLVKFICIIRTYVKRENLSSNITSRTAWDHRAMYRDRLTFTD